MNVREVKIMTKSEKQHYSSLETIAYYSGFSGIEIKGIEYDIEGHIIFIAGAWRSNKTIHRRKIYSSENGSYFICNGNRIKLSECIKC